MRIKKLIRDYIDHIFILTLKVEQNYYMSLAGDSISEDIPISNRAWEPTFWNNKRDKLL